MFAHLRSIVYCIGDVDGESWYQYSAKQWFLFTSKHSLFHFLACVALRYEFESVRIPLR